MGWREAVDLLRIIRADPSSMLAAAMEGWTHPLSRESLILMDHFDLTYAATGAKKRQPYPRPFKTSDSKKRGDAAGRSPEQVLRLLRPDG
jgi:hypothetical protein